MNRSSVTRRRSKLLTLAPLYGVPGGLLAAFLALASVRGPEGFANAPGAELKPEPMSLASLVPAADAGPGRRTASPAPAQAAAPAKAVAAAPRARCTHAARACPSAAPRVGPAPAAPVTAGLDAAIALVGPTIEELGEPAPDACAGMALPIEAPRVDGVSACPLTLQVVNVSAMSSEARQEWARAIRTAAEHARAARRARRIAGAI